jgi:ABC-type sugar transport system substrate-binding protein
MQGNPDLTGMVGFDSEAGPGIVRAVVEAGKQGQVIITSNEAGREYLENVREGIVKMVNMEKYETMVFYAMLYLYTYGNDLIRNSGMEQSVQNPIPAVTDSGLIFVTADNAAAILDATAPK